MKLQRSPSATQPLEAGLMDELRAQLELERNRYLSLEAIVEALTQPASMDELSTRLLQTFINDTGAACGVFWLVQAEELLPRAVIGLADDRAATALTLGQVLGVTASPRPALLTSAADDVLGRELGTPAALRIPVSGPERALGVMCLGFPEPPPLNDGQMAQLMKLAEYAASAVLQRESQDSLERSLRSRDEILGVVAHDLRNPLNVIAAASNSLHQRLPDLLSRRPVERIMRAAQRAEHLIRDLLDISAIERGQFSIEKRALDTTNLILAAIESQQGLAASSSVILASDLSPELPWIDADEERILEVLENLLGNAVKFTLAGGTTTVGASAKHEGELLLWVKDNGPGIPAEQLPHLFDRFWQGNRTDRRGAGLGLTICRAIVEAHGGRIWAESAQGLGTTVYFTLPTRKRAPKRGGTQVASILMVDDRPENLLSLSVILERPDYRLVSASSGEEALKLALRENFAVALIDIAMPGMDGLEVAVHMKELERSRDIPIIFITAFGDDPEEIHRAYSAGGADYLVKPLDIEIVRKKVAVFVDLSQRRVENSRLAAAGEE